MSKPTIRRRKNYELCLAYPDGSVAKVKVPQAVAFVAARGITRDTHVGALVIGNYGIATFAADGSGEVYWNQDSTMPGQKSGFDGRTTVCI